MVEFYGTRASPKCMALWSDLCPGGRREPPTHVSLPEPE